MLGDEEANEVYAFRRLLQLSPREVDEMPLWERDALIRGLNDEFAGKDGEDHSWAGRRRKRRKAPPNKDEVPGWMADLPVNG